MSTPRDLPDGYRTAPCCKNCIWCHDMSNRSGEQYRCGYGLMAGMQPKNSRNVDVDGICDSYRGESDR